jgi:hypothetical protein
MGTNLRCVKVGHTGIGDRPTVYMVAQGLVAEAIAAPVTARPRPRKPFFTS